MINKFDSSGSLYYLAFKIKNYGEVKEGKI